MLKRYSFDGERPFEDEPFGVWVKFVDHAAEVHTLNNQLTAAILERDALAHDLGVVQCELDVATQRLHRYEEDDL